MIYDKMVEIHLEYVIEKVEKKDNGNVEIFAVGYTPKDAIKAISPQMEMIMNAMPPEMRQMMEKQTKLFEEQEKPIIKFYISAKEYSEGKWKVGNTLDIIIQEREGE